MKKWIGWALAGVLLLTVTYAWQQHRRIANLETELGANWANEFSGSYFSRLGYLSDRLGRLGAGEPVQPDDRARLMAVASNMEVTMYNTFSAVQRIVPGLPAPRYLRGYLSEVQQAVSRIPVSGAVEPLSNGMQQDFTRYAETASRFVKLVQKQYPDFTPDGGFTGLPGYWGRPFLSDRRWQAAIAEMDAEAERARYLPQN